LSAKIESRKMKPKWLLVVQIRFSQPWPRALAFRRLRRRGGARAEAIERASAKRGAADWLDWDLMLPLIPDLQ
jgi:hypothetical protein